MPSFVDEQGVTIVYYEWPVDGARAVVQLEHGLGEHVGRYAHVVAALNAAGYGVVAADHRGHGQTGLGQWGDPAMLGKQGPGGFRASVTDASQLGAIIRESHPGLPVVLLGHSWGSFIAQHLMNRGEAANYAGLVLTGTSYLQLGYLNAGDLNARFRKLGTTGHEWLSRDVAVHRAFAEDPLCFHADVRRKIGLVDGLRLLAKPARDLGGDIPLLIMIGSQDPVGGEKSVVRLARAYAERSGLTDITVHVYPEARHEVFNELNKDEVIADLVAWLDDHTGAGA